MVCQKGPPRLRRGEAWSPQESRHRPLRDRDAQRAQFAVNPRRSPQRIRRGHLADERSNGRIRGGPPRTCPCRAPRPLTTKPLAVPPHHGIGLHDHDGGAPLLPRLGEKDPKESVPRTELWAPGRARQRGQLLTKREILEGDRPVYAANQSDRSK